MPNYVHKKGTKYTPEIKSYIKNNYTAAGSFSELTRLINSNFGTSYTHKQIKDQSYKQGSKLNLETAVKLKGGGALATYQTKLFLQPCCGLNYRKIAGRKCWRRDDVIRWLAITDADLKAYGDEWKVTIPDNYKSKKEAA